MVLRRRLFPLLDRGFAHYVFPFVMIALVAVIGGYIYISISSAATTSGAVYFDSGVSGKCLDDYYDGKANGTKVDLYTCNKSVAQEWLVNSNGTVENPNGKCIDNYEGLNKNNNKITMYTCSASNTAEQWKDTGDILKNPATGKCIDDSDASTVNNTQMILYTCNSKIQQKWTPVSSSSSGSTNGGGSTTTSTGFITASGMKLMLNGSQYRSISFDFSPLGDCWDTNWTTTQMDTFFAAIPKGSMARFFAPPDSTDSASFVESIVAQANKYDDHLIVALADADVDNNCDTENASDNGKTAAYYTDAPESGSTWYNWVQSVVKPLANNPGVAIWEISNEPLHAGVNLYDGQVTQSAFDTYVKDAAADIKAAEVAGAGSAKQLISIAPADMGDIGNASGAEGVFSYLNVVDDHDYSFDSTQGSPAVNPDFAIEEQVAKDLNKPFMVDEAGVEAGSCSSSTLYNAWDNGSQGTTLSNRVTLLITDKSTDYFNNGDSAIDFWLYTGQGGGCSYENIDTSDPLMAAARSYKMP